MFEKLDAETLAKFDKENAACDRFLQQQAARREQQSQPEIIHKVHDPNEGRTATAAEISQQWRDYIDQKIEEAKDEMIEIVGGELGTLFKEVDSEIKGVISRLVDLEVEAKIRHRTLSDNARNEMELIRRSLESMEQKISDACSRNEGVLPFVKRAN